MREARSPARLESRMFPTPAPVEWRRCARCRKPAHADRLVHGFGRDCAQRLGLLTATPRLPRSEQDGPDLFAAADEDDACDGWDHPGNRPH